MIRVCSFASALRELSLLPAITGSTGICKDDDAHPEAPNRSSHLKAEKRQASTAVNRKGSLSKTDGHRQILWCSAPPALRSVSAPRTLYGHLPSWPGTLPWLSVLISPLQAVLVIKAHREEDKHYAGITLIYKRFN